MHKEVPVNQILIGDWIERLKELPDKIFHCCITSPPYWGQRDYRTDGQLGLEKTPEEHIEKLVKGFREIRRIMAINMQGQEWVRAVYTNYRQNKIQI